jgi:hypothetical protein
VEGRPRLGPHLQDQLDRLFHLPDASRRPRRELPVVLLVFVLEKAGADAERQPSPADGRARDRSAIRILFAGRLPQRPYCSGSRLTLPRRSDRKVSRPNRDRIVRASHRDNSAD